ncbi:hypothetical protein SBA5_150078 [Candidatus Sulfotelmatomonas gaucii]|uniref:Uncharacterized protein n=1 Tax=Candidatus Sulfuritelmatomonas gaucii TaxID=2043161 RepID=A0A2N9L5P5_9BACT|nr:hypothetical protein SBA5_150078 [Candidatus Sulfotelmatomonas gaucii]
MTNPLTTPDSVRLVNHDDLTALASPVEEVSPILHHSCSGYFPSSRWFQSAGTAQLFSS